MLKIGATYDTARKYSRKPKVNCYVHLSMRRTALLLVAAAVLLMTQAARADEKADKQKAENIAMMRKILAARAGGFASLKGAQMPNDRKGDPVWAASVSPFGMQCEIVLGGSLQAYFCTNTSLQQQRSTKTGLADAAAGPVWKSIVDDFREAAPELKWTESRKGPHEFQEMLGAQADGKYLVDVELISLSADGDKDDAMVNFYVFATPLTSDPMVKQ
jgi:hypothetical protein